MIPSYFIKKRETSWKELERLVKQQEFRPEWLIESKDILRFARLYRSACTDLSMAAAYNLPREMRGYLEGLVSRGHAALYSRKRRGRHRIAEMFFDRIPYVVFHDVYVRICVTMFFIVFLLSGLAAYKSRAYAEAVAGPATLQKFERMHTNRKANRSAGQAMAGTGFYIWNNVGIDLLTFGLGIIGGVGSIFMTIFNGIYLGVVIGYLLQTPARESIIAWVIAHGPFELTAIGISAGAGLRIGYSVIAPKGRERMLALVEESRKAVPVIIAASILTACAAFIEGFISPTDLALLYKGMIAGSSILFLLLYFPLRGYILALNGYHTEDHSESGSTRMQKKPHPSTPEK